MNLSAQSTSLPGPLPPALAEIARLGFRYVDIPAKADRPAEDREALADSGLQVVCLPVGRDLPSGATLISSEVKLRNQAIAVIKAQVQDAAQLGASTVYIIPPKDDTRPEMLMPFGNALDEIALFAQSRRITFCVEHFPATALPSVSATLAWLQEHSDLQLLLDVGHCLISKEDPARAIEQAGARLGYVHLDDNDGAKDLHWPLLSGVLTREVLRDAWLTLRKKDYRQGIALELNPEVGDPVHNLRDGKKIVEELDA